MDWRNALMGGVAIASALVGFKVLKSYKGAESFSGEEREEVPNRICSECGNKGMVYVRLERSPLPLAQWHECPNCSYEFPFGAESFSANSDSIGELFTKCESCGSDDVGECVDCEYPTCYDCGANWCVICSGSVHEDCDCGHTERRRSKWTLL